MCYVPQVQFRLAETAKARFSPETGGYVTKGSKLSR
jgi:hypothetical protein